MNYDLLKHIPGYTGCRGVEEDTQELYITERNAIITEEDLLAFIDRWSSLYQLSIENCVGIPIIIINPAEVLSCMLKAKTGLCDHAARNELCNGSVIMLPMQLYATFSISQKYGVPTSIAMHQIFCDGDHDNCY